MIQVYIGEGKGKTTASIGLSIRAAGHGFNVLFMQFLKDDSSGEISVLRSISGIEVIHCPVNYGFTFQMTEDQKKEIMSRIEGSTDISIVKDADLIIEAATEDMEAKKALFAELNELVKPECILATNTSSILFR